MRLHGEPVVRRLDEIARREAADLASEGPHVGPLSDMLQHRIGMDDIECVVGVLRHGAAIALMRLEAGVIEAFGLKIDENELEVAAFPDRLKVEPVIAVAAHIEDADFVLGLQDLICEGDKTGQTLGPVARLRTPMLLANLTGHGQFLNNTGLSHTRGRLRERAF